MEFTFKIFLLFVAWRLLVRLDVAFCVFTDKTSCCLCCLRVIKICWCCLWRKIFCSFLWCWRVRSVVDVCLQVRIFGFFVVLTGKICCWCLFAGTSFLGFLWCLRVRSDVGVYGVRFLGFSVVFTSDVCAVYASDFFLGGGVFTGKICCFLWCWRARSVVFRYDLLLLFVILTCKISPLCLWCLHVRFFWKGEGGCGVYG